jgi:hypothetical protein
MKEVFVSPSEKSLSAKFGNKIFNRKMAASPLFKPLGELPQK